jgi:putative tryptophan/tyrosine transport system substrate-binding protein
MQFDQLKRREVLSLLGAAVACPFAASAQQPAIPVIGLLESRSSDVVVDRLRAFRQGLKDNGYVEGDNVIITYRWAENQLDRLPELAAELVRRRVAVIAATGGATTVFAAKAASATIPILFLTPEDPVRLGLVVSLARPGGNLTGINFLNAELAAKQLEFLRELVPGAARIALFVNPNNPTSTETTLRDVQGAAHIMGLQIQVLRVSTSQEINTAFAKFERERPDAVFRNASSVGSSGIASTSAIASVLTCRNELRRAPARRPWTRPPICTAPPGRPLHSGR